MSGTCALVESPVQLLNVLEWAYRRAVPDGDLTLVVLPPRNPATRGQLARMAGLARDEGHQLVWQEARGAGGAASLSVLPSLSRRLRRADRLVIGDPFSRWLQLLLATSGSRTEQVIVVDDGTATLEFTAQLGRGERLVRWHRSGARRGVRAALFAPVARGALRRLSPGAGHHVEVFTAMPAEAPRSVVLSRNDLDWTRARFGPPSLVDGADLVGSSLVETGVVRADRYHEGVRALAERYGVTRYFAHRKESPEKLKRLAAQTGVAVVRPDLPLELVARGGPTGRQVLSFPSTVVHTLPLVLRGTGAEVTVVELDDTWLTSRASPRASGFLSGIARSARSVHGLTTLPAPRGETA